MKQVTYIAGVFLTVALLVLLFMLGKQKFQSNGLDNKELSKKDTVALVEVLSQKTELTLAEDSLQTDTFSYLGTPYRYFTADTRKHQIEFLLQDTNGNPIAYLDSAVAQLAKEDQLPIFATNAGIFKPDFIPEGLFVNEGVVLQDLNTETGQGNFYLLPNGVFYIQYSGEVGVRETQDFDDNILEVDYATQSGPLLLNAGKIHPKFNEGSANLRVRSGVGIISPNEAVFLLSQTPVNFYDFARTFKERFGCQDALYLDGVISEFYHSNHSEQSNHQRFSGIIVVSESEQLPVQ